MWTPVMQARAERSRLLEDVARMRWRAAFARQTRRADSSSLSMKEVQKAMSEKAPKLGPNHVVFTLRSMQVI